MTAGNNDDPFAYLYRPEGGEGDADDDAAQGRTAAQPGVPRTSYNQVQRVGERRQSPPQQGGYGYPPQQGGYGYPPQQQYGQQPQYGQQAPYGQGYGQQQAQPTQALPQQPGGGGDWGGGRGAGGPQGRGPNSKGLLIGAVAVVAAVAIGIGVAIANGDDGTDNASGGATPSATAPSAQQSTGGASPSASAPAGALPGTTDAATLVLGGGASVASDVSGAAAAGGKYVQGMNNVGASATWTFNAPKAGQYTLFVTYSVPGSDSNSTITVNGKKQDRPLSMENYAHAPAGNWEKGWTKTFGYIPLKEGQNTVSLSCEAGNTCNFYLDQFSLKEGQVRS